MIPQTPLDRLITWSALLPPLMLLAAAYWLNQVVQPLASPDRKQRHDADFIVTKFSATTLNEQGTPRFKIAAQQMLHFPDDDSTQLDAPQLTLLSADRPSLYATASKGTISGKGDEVFLRDEVKIVRAATATQSELVFTTSYLHVIPDRDLANTDQPVTIMDARNTINAIGMQMDNKARTVKLLAQVRSEHAPPRLVPGKK